MDCLSDELLAELETGTLDEAADTKARAHLGGCAKCRAIQRELAASLRAYAGLKEDRLETKPSPKVWQSVATRLASDRVPAAKILIACVYCKGRLQGALYCASCLAPHHADCWETHGRCAACSATLFVRAESRVRKELSRWAAAASVVGILAATLGGVAALNASGVFSRKDPAPVPVMPQPTLVDPPHPKRELRRFQAGRFRVDSPVGLDATTGALEVVARDGTLHSIDARTGQATWRAAPAIGEFGDPSPGAAVFAGKAVFTAGCDGTIRAHDARSGALVWATSLGSAVAVAPRVSASGATVVAGTVQGEVVLLDGDSGAVRARIDVGRVSTAPALTETLVYVAALDELLGIDLASAEIVERYPVDAAITAGPLVQGGRIWIGTQLGTAYRIDPLSAERGFSAKGAGPITAIVASEQGVGWTSRGEVHWAELAPAPGSAVVSSRISVVFERPIAGVVPLSDHRLAVVLTDGTLEALDLTHGGGWVRAWSHAIAPAIEVAAPPVFFGDELYVFTTDGSVFVLDPRH